MIDESFPMDRDNMFLTRLIKSCVLLAVVYALLAISLAADAQAVDRAALAARVNAQLQREIDFWYSGDLIDTKLGGFSLHGPSTDSGPQVRTLVYQSRLTWCAAELIRRRPELRDRLMPSLRHGVAFLRESLWDPVHGGFFWQVTHTDGTWQAGPEKHTYGHAFAIYALANGYLACGDRQMLQMALDAFDWLEAHAHDPMHGGYYDALTLDGKPILHPASGRLVDSIGTHYGYKSMNAGIHTMEALAMLYQAQPSEPVRKRLSEMLHIIRDRMVVPPGAMALEFTADWRAVPASTSYGHNIETAYLLREASHILEHGQVDIPTDRIAHQLVDQSIAAGWDDEHGGLFELGSAFGSITDRRKSWWSQAEAFGALIMEYDRTGDAAYFHRAQALWDFIERDALVESGGAWRRELGMEASSENSRLWTPSLWQACYHTMRSELNAIFLLNKTHRNIP